MAKNPKDPDFFTEGQEKFNTADVPAGMTNEQLMAMLLKVMQENAQANRQLSEALLESRKPYVDPKVLEQKQRELEERRRMIALEQRERAARKRICPHKRENGTFNIKWHRHSNNIILGVCGTCFSTFDARNVADLDLLRQDLKSQKNMGKSGEHAVRGYVLEG